MNHRLLLLLLLTTSLCSAQGLAAFHDYRNYFIVFDHGVFWEAEYLRVNKFNVTKNFVVYVGNDEKLKAFSNGKKKVITEYYDYYHVGEDFVVYEYGKHVYLYKDGVTTDLCDWCNGYAADSIMRIIKQPGSIQEITLAGNTTVVTKDVETTTLKTFRMTKNIFCWTDAGNNLKVLYKGEIWDMGANNPGKFQSAANIVVWTDQFEMTFKAFYKGMIYDLETQLPKYYVTGDNMIAYVDYNGHFKIFYDGKTTEISAFEPTALTARDELMVYGMNGWLKVFYKGKEYLIEEYIPDSYGFSLNTLGYIDRYGKLAVFSAGEHKRNLTLEKSRKVEFHRDVMLFETGINTMNAYWDGKIYTY